MALKDEFTDNGLTEEEQAVMDEIDSEETHEEAVDKQSEEVEESTEAEAETTEEKEDAQNPEEEITKEDEVTPDVADTFVPKFDTGGDALAEIDTKLTEIESSIKELRDNYEDGGIDVDEFLDKREELFMERAEMSTSKAIYENNIKNNEDLDSQLWAHDQKVFFEDKSNAVFNENTVLYGALDSTVKALASNPENAGRTGNWILNEAKRQVLSVFNQDDGQTDPKNKKPAVKSKKKDIPVTLANIPASEENESSRDEFSHIDALIEKGDVNGMEQALSAMSSSQQARYLAQTGE